MKLQDDSSTAAHQGLKLVTDHVDVEFRHIELLVPILVELFRLNQICQLNILEPVNLVFFRKLIFEKGAERGLAHSWSPCYQDVRQASLLMLRGFHYLLYVYISFIIFL